MNEYSRRVMRFTITAAHLAAWSGWRFADRELECLRTVEGPDGATLVDVCVRRCRQWMRGCGNEAGEDSCCEAEYEVHVRVVCCGVVMM